MIALDRLQQIIPADQALANKALATSLQQIGGINNLTLPNLALVTAAMQTTKDLPQITALTQPVPASVANYFTSTLADGTGPDGTILIVDLLGTAAGWISTDAMIETVAILSTMNTNALTTVYQTMNDVVTGVYGDPILGPVIIPAGPYAGSYTDANEVFSTVLTPAAQTEITTLTTTYPTETASLNTLWTNMANQLATEQTLQAAANLSFANLQSNQKNSIYGFIFSLPGYGLDTEVGGTAQVVEAVADLTTFTGQAIVACLREGSNQRALGSAGIVVSNNIPEEPATPPPQAVLIPSEYTAAEAANLVVK